MAPLGNISQEDKPVENRPGVFLSLAMEYQRSRGALSPGAINGLTVARENSFVGKVPIQTNRSRQVFLYETIQVSPCEMWFNAEFGNIRIRRFR